MDFLKRLRGSSERISLSLRLETCFCKYCQLVEKRAFLILSISLIVLCAGCFGLLRWRLDTDVFHSLAVPNSEQENTRLQFESLFGPFPSMVSLIVSLRYPVQEDLDSTDVIMLPVLEELWVLQQTIAKNLTVPNPNNASQLLSLEDVCMRLFLDDRCYVKTVLDHWKSLSQLRHDPDLHGTVSLTSASDVYGWPIKAREVMGDIRWSREIIGRIESAGVLFVDYYFNNSLSLQPAVQAFEEQLYKLSKQMNDSFEYAQWEILAPSTIGADIQSYIVSGYLPLTGIAFVLFALCLLLGLGGLPPLKSRMLLALVSLAVLLLSLLSGLGFACLVGVPINILTFQLISAILFGLGGDAIFILTRTFSYHSQHMSISLALRHSISIVGVAAAFAVVAFLVALLAPISLHSPVVLRYLCLQAAIAVVFVMGSFFCTFFVALMFCSRLQQKNRVDCIPCLNSTPKSNLWSFCGPVIQFYKRLMSFLFRPPFRLLILLCFVIGALCAAAPISQMKVDLDLFQLMPRDSSVNRYLDLKLNVTPSAGTPVFCVFPDLEYDDPAIGDALKQVSTDLEASLYLTQDIQLWYSDFENWIYWVSDHWREYQDNGFRIPSDQFYPWLSEFLDQEGTPHRMNLVFSPNGDILVASRLQATLRPYVSAPVHQLIHTMEGLEADIHQTWKHQFNDAIRSSVEFAPFSFTLFYPLLSQFLSFERDFLFSILISGGSILVIGLLLLFFHPLQLLAVTFLLILVVLDTLAFFSVVGIPLNHVVLLTVGWGAAKAFSFCIYYVQEYNSRNLRCYSPAERVLVAFDSVGPAIFLSCFSSVVVLSVFCYSNFPLVQIYFGLTWLLAAFVAGIHSFLLLPVLLSFISSLHQQSKVPSDQDSKPLNYVPDDSAVELPDQSSYVLPDSSDASCQSRGGVDDEIIVEATAEAMTSSSEHNLPLLSTHPI